MRTAILFPFFAATQCLELAVVFFIVYLKISRRPETLSFSLIALFLGGMICFELLLQEAVSISLGLLWYRLQFACIFASMAMLLAFISQVIGRPLSQTITLGALYPAAVVLAASAFHPLVLHLPRADCLPSNVDREAPGPLFYPYASLSMPGAILASVIGLRGWKRSLSPEDADFKPLNRHVVWIVAGILLVVLAGLIEIGQLLLIPETGHDLPINPRAVAVTLFCLITACVLGHEVFLTEQRKLQLDDENKFLDALTEFRLQTVRDVQHEVMNKLDGIAMPIQFVALELNGRQEAVPLTKCITTALAEIAGLNRLVQTMLNTARMEAGHAPVLEPKRSTDIAALVQSLCRQKERMLEQEQQAQRWRGADAAAQPHYQFEIESSLVRAVAPAHADTLTLILCNLLDNAVKFSPSGGCICICLKEWAGDLRIAISDPGLGIAIEDQSRIFTEPFHRGRAATRAIAGTGLGLNLVKRLVEAQSGVIRVESAPDRGSVFHITIPWDREEQTV